MHLWDTPIFRTHMVSIGFTMLLLLPASSTLFSVIFMCLQLLERLNLEAWMMRVSIPQMILSGSTDSD